MGKTSTSTQKLPNDGIVDHADVNCGKMLKGMDIKEKRLSQGNALVELEPAAIQVLHELVSLVHKCVSMSQDQESLSASTSDHSLGENDECKKRVAADLNDDPLAKIIRDVKPQTLQYIFLALAHNFPRTLVALVLRVLSPIGAEVLTRLI
ncbi:hypothetical protein PIB30_099936 [Stylosanthes scabra]|uniref:Uncharacterized protein n=1 Tax=Stylosanthes scabra TaxID=79078 RepID=A0ABU6YYF4_9FABA|nr:hypothetical protein [Stylosanthes scabra]